MKITLVFLLSLSDHSESAFGQRSYSYFLVTPKVIHHSDGKPNPDVHLPPYCLTLCPSGLSFNVTASDHPHLPPYPQSGLCGLHNTPQAIWHSCNNTLLLLPLTFTLDSKLLRGRDWRSFSALHMTATQ